MASQTITTDQVNAHNAKNISKKVADMIVNSAKSVQNAACYTMYTAGYGVGCVIGVPVKLISCAGMGLFKGITSK